MVLGIYGAGGLGREVLELARIINQKKACWEQIILLDDNPANTVCNHTMVMTYAKAKEVYGSKLEITIGVGEPATRKLLIERVIADNITLATLIHPNIFIPDTTVVGRGVTITMGCFISCNVVIKDYVFIQPHANIGHDCILEDGCIISSFCNIAGAVHIGKYSYLGLSVCVKEKARIGDYSIVGMASAVLRDIPDEMIAMGNPARPMRKNEEKQVFR